MKHLRFLPTAFISPTSRNNHFASDQKGNIGKSDYMLNLTKDVIISLRAGEGMSNPYIDDEHDEINIHTEHNTADEIIASFRNELKRMREELEREAEMEIQATKRMIEKKEKLEREQQRLASNEKTEKVKQQRCFQRSKRLDKDHEIDEESTNIDVLKEDINKDNDFIDSLIDDSSESELHDETPITNIHNHGIYVQPHCDTEHPNPFQTLDEIENDNSFIASDTGENHNDVMEKPPMDEQKDQKPIPKPKTNEESALDTGHDAIGISEGIQSKKNRSSITEKPRRRKKKRNKKKKKRKSKSKLKRSKESMFQDLSEGEASEWYDKLVSDDYNKSNHGGSMTTMTVIMRSLVPTLVLAILLYISHVVFEALFKRI